MKSKRKDEPDITARPRPVFDEIGEAPDDEPGLSIDTEDLGAHFLSEATETSTRRRPDELSLVEAAPSDEALVGPNFDPDHSVWESTVELTLQEEEEGHAPAEPSDEESDEEGDEDQDMRATLDLTQDNIREASLLDEEGEELGEVESPVLITDDNRHLEEDEDTDPPARK